jgi:hypothetical protein
MGKDKVSEPTKHVEEESEEEEVELVKYEIMSPHKVVKYYSFIMVATMIFITL